MFAEKYFALKLVENAEDDMLFSTPIAVASLFLLISSVNIKKSNVNKGVFLRKITTIVFAIHMFMAFYMSFVLKVIHINANSLVRYIVTVLASILFAIIVICLSDKIKFLKKFF